MHDRFIEQIDRDYLAEMAMKARSKRFFSNAYTVDLFDKACGMWEIKDEFIFLVKDNGVNRLYFYVEKIEHLSELLHTVPSGIYYYELLSKNKDVFVPTGTSPVTALLRLANNDCNSVFDENSAVKRYRKDIHEEVASEKDAKEINEVLWSIFHPEISHLLSDEELVKRINEGCITIHRNEQNKIDAILQTDVMPKKFYINQIVNKAEREVIHSILLNKLEKYVKDGGKYLYAWVESDNIASIKFHEKYGMKHDGTWNLVYRVDV